MGINPDDFVGICYANLERKLGKSVTGNGEWADPVEQNNTSPSHDRFSLTDRKTALESWRDQHQPQLHGDLEPWVGFSTDLRIQLDLVTNPPGWIVGILFCTEYPGLANDRCPRVGRAVVRLLDLEK